MQPDEMKYVLYLAVNQVNGKKYVGFTSRGLERCKAQHERDSQRGEKRYLCNAIRKYGSDSFRWCVVGWSTDAEDIKSQEIAHIEFYKSLGEDLYNMTDGGDGALNPSPEVRVKMSAGGRKHVESGHLASIAGMGGRATNESTNGRKGNGGRKAAESGQIQALGKSGIGGRISGRIVGRQNAESGQVHEALHVRWHVKRNIVKLDCKLCNPNAAQISEKAIAA